MRMSLVQPVYEITIMSRWTDERLTREEFRSIKEDTAKLPYGQMPVLHYNGQIIAQSLTVARYVDTVMSKKH